MHDATGFDPSHMHPHTGNNATRTRNHGKDLRQPVNFIAKTVWALSLLLPLAACAKQEAPAKTMTNEQGCTRIRSIGPQDPYKDPPPLKQACLGPHLLEIPQNYFENQIGPEHDGLFALALEYPSLEPFKPGERMRLSADVSVRTVRVVYDFIDRLPVEEVMKNSYTPMDYQAGDPEHSLDGRIKGKTENGLTPYFIDIKQARAHYAKEGYQPNARVMELAAHKDWFIGIDDAGTVNTVIKCTPKDIIESGVEYQDGKLVKNDAIGVARCDHVTIMPKLDVIIRMAYPREGLSQWKNIQDRAQLLITQFDVEAGKEARP